MRITDAVASAVKVAETTAEISAAAFAPGVVSARKHVAPFAKDLICIGTSGFMVFG